MKGADRGQDIQDQSAFQWPKLQPHPPVLRRPGDIGWTDHHSLSIPPPTPAVTLVDKSMFTLLLSSANPTSFTDPNEP